LGAAIGSFILVLLTLWAIIVSQQALRTTRRIFEQQNMPYLQISDFQISNDTLYFTITNLGQYPAKITGVDFNIGAALTTDSSGTIKSIRKTVFKPPPPINKYVTKEYPVRSYVVGDSFDPKYKSIFKGYVTYNADEIKTNRVYMFEVSISDFQFTENANYYDGTK
jgi:hypothetical protein